jgi:ubiquinone/menaquinone biosynthesis C-methylase UbiE
MDEATVQNFWGSHPCGDQMVGRLDGKFEGDYVRFFDAYDAFKYRTEPHILAALDRFDFDGKKVLEIGLGQGAESEQLIRRGAEWSGLDLTQEAVERVSTRTKIRSLPFDDIKVGTALAIPYPDSSFDVVFSHGVLHHVPDIKRAQAEIRRVLRDDGSLIVMLYAKRSLNYGLSIAVVRRLGLMGLTLLRINLGGAYEQHRQNAREQGLFNYLAMRNFVHRSTDGPLNPYSKVYTVEGVRQDFTDFRIVDHFKRWMHAPPLPTDRIPGGELLGWHLWVHMKPQTA